MAWTLRRKSIARHLAKSFPITLMPMVILITFEIDFFMMQQLLFQIDFYVRQQVRDFYIDFYIK